jgi:hypothetical protein
LKPMHVPERGACGGGGGYDLPNTYEPMKRPLVGSRWLVLTQLFPVESHPGRTTCPLFLSVHRSHGGFPLGSVLSESVQTAPLLCQKTMPWHRCGAVSTTTAAAVAAYAPSTPGGLPGGTGGASGGDGPCGGDGGGCRVSHAAQQDM